MNSISKIQEEQDTLYPNCDTKNTIYLYQKGSRYRIPQTPGRARSISVCIRTESRTSYHGKKFAYGTQTRLVGMDAFLIKNSLHPYHDPLAMFSSQGALKRVHSVQILTL